MGAARRGSVAAIALPLLALSLGAPAAASAADPFESCGLEYLGRHRELGRFSGFPLDSGGHGVRTRLPYVTEGIVACGHAGGRTAQAQVDLGYMSREADVASGSGSTRGGGIVRRLADFFDSALAPADRRVLASGFALCVPTACGTAAPSGLLPFLVAMYLTCMAGLCEEGGWALGDLVLPRWAEDVNGTLAFGDDLASAWLDMAGAGTACPDTGAAAAEASWSCVARLQQPSKSPQHHSGFKHFQLRAFDLQSAVVPHWGPRTEGYGLARRAVPEELILPLRDAYRERHGSFCAQHARPLDNLPGKSSFVGVHLFNQYHNDHDRPPCRADMSDVPTLPRVIERVHDLLEAWVGVELLPQNQNVVFADAIIDYPPGSVVMPHNDHVHRHQISATLVIDVLNPRRGWPLEVTQWDRAGGRYNDSVAIYTQPGDLVAYQGARWEHSRPHPLDADGYAALVLHYKVAGADLEWFRDLLEAEL